MRRVSQIMTFLCLALALGIGFQNCSGYESVTNPLYDFASSTCIGLACGTDTSLLKLTIANDSSVAVRKVSPVPSDCNGNDSLCIDIGGYCDDGGFFGNQIYASINGGTVNKAEYNTGSKCVNGRFQAQIMLPPGYDYDNIHTLGITVYGYDSAGVRYTNETSGNHREVYIVSYTIP